MVEVTHSVYNESLKKDGGRENNNIYSIIIKTNLKIRTNLLFTLYSF